MRHQNSFNKLVRYEPYLHILFWVMVLISPYIKYLGKEGGYPNSIFHELNALFFHIAFSYFIYFLILRNRIKWQMVTIVVVALLLAYLHEFFDSFFHDETFQNYSWKQLVSHLISYATFGIVFYALHISKDAYHKQSELLILHQENQVANMSALKAQVTPHFLFNTLNTIYKKVLSTDKESADLLLMLSDNVRYFLKEGQKDKVGITEEINHIKNYIQLQSQRWKNKLDVHFSQEGIYEQLEVAPLFFIPFVENAFKYASQLRGGGHIIEVRFLVENKELTFTCTNPYPNKAQSMIEKGDNSGIGIPNVRKRLQLIYPNKHALEVSTKDQKFTVNLTLNLC